jgi:3-phenylpropionate/trans-cinnamate dioxygenase ferredoxin component
VTTRVRLCAKSELPVGSCRRFEVGDTAIVLVACADGVHALEDRCSHEDYLLSEGEVDAEACEIECWKHGSMFSLRTGEPESLPATRPVRVYEVEVDGDDVIGVFP